MLRAILLFSICRGAFGQAPDNSALKGKYYFVQLLVVGSTVGQPLETVSAGGTLTFDGSGGYRYDAMRGTGAAAAERVDGSGSYSVAANAFMEMTNPVRPSVKMNGRVARGAFAVLGSSTESADGICDFFVAVRATDAPATTAGLDGTYTGASLVLPDGGLEGLATTLYQFTASDNVLSRILSVGHAADVKNTTLRKPVVPEAVYTLRPDGSGAAPVGFFSPLQIFSSFDGQVVLGFAPQAGQRGIFIGVRNVPQRSAWQGTFWMSEMLLDNEIAGAVRFSSSIGALTAGGAGQAGVSQRMNPLEPWRDVTAVNEYQAGADGSGQLGPALIGGRINFAVGADVFAGAQIGMEGEAFRLHGLFFGARMFDAAVVIRNAASLAPPTAPVSAASRVTVTGEGLDAEGMAITFNDAAVPILEREAGSLTVQAPPSLQGDTATIRIARADGRVENTIVPVAGTSPGVFTTAGTGFGWGYLEHADGRQVNGENPALPGELIGVSATGVDASSNVMAFVDGNPAPILAVEQTADLPGYLRLTLRVPVKVRSGIAIPFAIATVNAFTCMADIPIK